MANAKISALTEGQSSDVTTSDIIAYVDLSAGTSGTKKVTKTNFLGLTGSSTQFLDGTGAFSTPAGGGDMVAATYDPATISEQLVGLTASQTLTNKTIPNYSASGHTHNNYLASAANLSDLNSAATARTNLGLGSIATHATTEYSASDHTHGSYLASAANLSDLNNATTARTNLGLGSIATHNTTEYSASDHTHTQYAASQYGSRIMGIKVFADDTAVASGDGKSYLTVPSQLNGMNIVDLDAGVTASTTAAGFSLQVNNQRTGSDILSTAVTIDASEYSSYTAATPPVINTSADDLQTGDRLRIDVDGAAGASGLDVFIVAQTP